MMGRPPRGLLVVSAIAAAVVVVQLARMAVYMVRADAVGWSAAPWNAFTTTHSCLSGYWAAARHVDHDPNVWSDELRLEPASAGRARVPRRVGPFPYDTYEYTPTFLLLPRALLRLTPDFFALRPLWYALNVALVVWGVVAIARRLVGAAGPGVLWLAPLVLAPMSVLATFQIGNLQLACVAGSALAMLAFERARGGTGSPRLAAAGGLLLAFMAVSKLYPGVLALYLLLRGDRRAVAWTAGWAIVLVLAGIADLGLATHRAFLDHLPSLLSGETFPNLRVPRGIAANMSIPGLALKLGLYGGPVGWFAGLRVLGWIYSAILLLVVARLAWRPVPAAWEPVTWIVILLLATLRSPVLPPYGTFPLIWLVAILLAARWTDVRARVGLLVWAALLSVIGHGQTFWPPEAHALFTAVVQTAGALVASLAAVHVARTRPAPAPALASREPVQA